MFKFWRRKHDENNTPEPQEKELAVENVTKKRNLFGGLFGAQQAEQAEEAASSTPAMIPTQVSEPTLDPEGNSELSDASLLVAATDSFASAGELTAIPLEQKQPSEEFVEVELPIRKISGVRSLFGKAVDLNSLEEVLLRADFGVETSEEIAAELKVLSSKKGASSDAELRLLLKDLLTEKLKRSDSALNLSDAKLPYVLLVVGVNGAGKTTTIGKLAKWLRDGQWEVVLGAADTFRAAAVEQLATWAERSNSVLVRPEKEGQDPAAVAYQTVEKAISTGADIAIIDTAGRLQNKKDLMDELAKIRRAVEKQAQVNEVLLVIDATTGQNGLSQARAFTEVANVTGIVMTKLDGSAKGGILYNLQSELNIPIKLVGVGEGINDFAFFDPEEFARGLVAVVD